MTSGNRKRSASVEPSSEIAPADSEGTSSTFVVSLAKGSVDKRTRSHASTPPIPRPPTRVKNLESLTKAITSSSDVPVDDNSPNRDVEGSTKLLEEFSILQGFPFPLGPKEYFCMNAIRNIPAPINRATVSAMISLTKSSSYIPSLARPLC